MTEGAAVETFWPRAAWRRRFFNERLVIFGCLYTATLIPLVLLLAPGPIDQVWRYAETIVPVLLAGCAVSLCLAWLTARASARRLDRRIAALPSRAAPHLEEDESLVGAAHGHVGPGLATADDMVLGLTDRRLFVVRRGGSETVTPLSELGRAVVVNRAAEAGRLVGAGLLVTRDYLALDLFPPVPDKEDETEEDETEEDETEEDETEEDETEEDETEGDEKEDEASPPPQRFARVLIDRLVFDAFARQLHLAGVKVDDPLRMLPGKTFKVGGRVGAELFWPPPRREVARWLISFAFLLLGVMAVPVGLLMFALARARSPGVTELGAHFATMAWPVSVAVVLLTVTIGIMAIGQLFELRWRLRKVTRWLELEADESLEAVCLARAGRGRDGREPWAERVRGLLRFDWHAFLAITDRRILRYAGHRTEALADRSEVVALARTPRGDDRAVLVAALLQAVGQTYELHVHLREGEPIVVTAECMFFEPLVTWMSEHGFRLEGVGWVPPEPEPESALEPAPEAPEAPEEAEEAEDQAGPSEDAATP